MEKEDIMERQEQKPVMNSAQCDKYSAVDLSLEEVEEEIRLEKIRQTSLKFSWDYLSQLLRRNLMVGFFCDICLLQFRDFKHFRLQ